MMKNDLDQLFKSELDDIQAMGNLRSIPKISHQGKFIIHNNQQLINFSSNDYLGLASDIELQQQFVDSVNIKSHLFSTSSSRLLTGNSVAYESLELLLSSLFKSETALIFNSGYHMNLGILPAISNSKTLILADKLVHASIIDGIRLASGKSIRFQHQNQEQLERLVAEHVWHFERIIIVTESIFSMDGDVTDLKKLVKLKKQYQNVLLYVDEAHAFGVRGKAGLGCAEEQDCIKDIDVLTGTFGKAIASVGAYLICNQTIKSILVNKMRPLIYTTALPPINLLWTKFVLEQLDQFQGKRDKLTENSAFFRNQLLEKGYICPSESQIIPIMIGDSQKAKIKAEKLQEYGFYVLPIRPPTVPQNSARIRISITAQMKRETLNQMIDKL